jgi:hypothetical protein
VARGGGEGGGYDAASERDENTVRGGKKFWPAAAAVTPF